MKIKFEIRNKKGISKIKINWLPEKQIYIIIVLRDSKDFKKKFL
jgi:hypothetical protein